MERLRAVAGRLTDRLGARRRALLVIAAAMLLCLPSALTAWRGRDYKHFGSTVDDGIYWVTAKALAERAGYRIVSLPSEPWQTKYPPLYPAYLALAWKIKPEFPDNLPLGVLSSWLWAPPLLGLSLLATRKLGLSPRQAVAIAALLAVNPHFLYFTTGVHTEVPYTVLLLTAILLLERAGARAGLKWPVAAGVLAAAAFLCRTAGIALVLSGAAGLLLRRRVQAAAIYLASALPAVVGWTWWAQTHRYEGPDPTLIYHTDYIRFYLETARLQDLPVLLWNNAGGILIRGGMLVVPTPGETTPERLFSIIVAVLAFLGVWRLARRVGPSQYHWYAVGHLSLLLPWNFPADSRLLFPLAPLLMAGLFEEVRNILAMARAALRAGPRAERLAGTTMLITLAVLGAIGAWRWSRPLAEHYPQRSERYRRQLQGVEQAYRWIREQTPAGA
ncbi:MAG: glycosyltransferase family 39 protein, partial [Bryobacterales bacterium]|nr:glycosyltransferase family 39 protein [Bryobacterales bacterium]